MRAHFVNQGTEVTISLGAGIYSIILGAELFVRYMDCSQFQGDHQLRGKKKINHLDANFCKSSG